MDKNKKLDHVRIIINVGLDKLDEECIIETEEQLKKYLEDYYCTPIEEILKNGNTKFNEYLKEIKKGNKIVICNISNEDFEGIGGILYNGFNKFKIVNGEYLGEEI